MTTSLAIDSSALSARAEVLPPATIPSLNGLRAISVLIVVLSHAGLGSIVPGGLGVTIFFFLSGFLITSLLLVEHQKNARIDILSFYARRAFRLIPPLFITLTIAYGLVYAGLLAGGVTTKALLSQLFYFANYYELFMDPGNTTAKGTDVLWSLAIEEHFYLVYPFLLALLLKMKFSNKTMGIVLSALCVTILLWRIYLVSTGASESRTHLASDTRMDSIIFGCLLAILAKPMASEGLSKKMSVIQWAALVLSLGGLTFTIVNRNPMFRETFRYSIQGLALMPIFYFAIRFHANSLFRHLNSRWIGRLGVYSYFIYLIHAIVINSIITVGPAKWDKPYILVPAALFISICYAAMIDVFIDPYFRNLRQKWHPAAPVAADVSNPTGMAVQSV